MTRTRIGLLSVLATAATACTSRGPTGAIADCAGKLVSGDLVITEIMANPGGTDTGKEWFEVRNSGASALDLEGVQIVAEKNDATGPKTHTMKAAAIPAYGYLVLGDGAVGSADVDYSYGTDLGALRNEDGQIIIKCGMNVVATAIYDTTSEGESLAFDGRDWCDAETPTPGAENASCGGGPPPTGKCSDAGGSRDVRAPGAGDLVITEILPNPTGNDAGKEWFEVVAKADVDLNGLEMGTTPGTTLGTVTSSTCIAVTAGQTLVFAHNDGSAEDGGLPREDVHFAFDLVNSNRGVFLASGGTVVDSATYATVTEGVARSLDAAGTWCDTSAAAYGDGPDRGTPGAANPSCGTVTQPGTCDDGGHARAIVAPAAGDLVISEIMADPTKVTDGAGEWFEVTVKADVDVNGLLVGGVAIVDEDCRPVSAGDRLVFGRVGSGNGGLPALAGTFDFSLAQSNGSIVLATEDGVVDEVHWSTSTPGHARSLDPAHVDAGENDDAASWCVAAATYGDGDFGTPGRENASCDGGGDPGDDECQDGEATRKIVAPVVGDLLVTEVMPNTAGASEGGKEWFEVLVTRDVDLVGLSIASGAKTTTYSTTDCQRVAAGTYLVFANGESATPHVDYLFDFTLVNSSSGVAVSVGGMLLDSAVWSSTTDATSKTLKKSKFDTVSNDSAANFCNSTLVYGDGTNHGTPGADDPSCQ